MNKPQVSEKTMKDINQRELAMVSGGEVLPGYPSPEVQCINAKLMITAGREQPGFDVTSAVLGLLNACPLDFWDPAITHEYVINGGWNQP